MAPAKPSPPVPAELEAACHPLLGTPNYEIDKRRTSYRYCRELSFLGEQDGYTWGYRIYRTSYTSDANFQEAMDVLREYMHYECYIDYTSRLEALEKKGLSRDTVDERPNQQLWSRLKNEIVQDREQLEGASPGKIRTIAQNWTHSLGNKVHTSPRYRLCLMIDDDAIETLLRHPMPAVRPPNISLARAVKVIDSEFGLPDSYHSDVEDEEEDGERDDDDEEDEAGSTGLRYVGWFWAGASMLMDLWLIESELDTEELYTWDDERQPLHLWTSMNTSRNLKSEDFTS
jgi:hypothetical protein